MLVGTEGSRLIVRRLASAKGVKIVAVLVTTKFLPHRQDIFSPIAGLDCLYVLPIASNWAVVKARRDLPMLYDVANAPGAMEWQSVRFWQAFLEAWRDDTDRAVTITSQAPPDIDTRSESRRRRVDIIVEGYSRENRTKFTILIVEVKGAHVSSSQYETIKNQAREAYETYVNTRESESKMIYDMCAVRTECRMFRQTNSLD